MRVRPRAGWIRGWVLVVAAVGIAVAAFAIVPSLERRIGPAPGCGGRSPCSFTAREVAFDYPGSWYAAQFEVVSSFSSVLVYLSTEPPADPCDRTANSVDCIREAVPKLAAGGVLITWTHWGFPGHSFDPSKPPQIVGGRQASSEESDASAGCRGIGGAHELLVTIPIPDAIDNWIEVDACLAGPDPRPAQAQVEAMLTSVVWK